MDINEISKFLSELPLPAAHFNPSGEVVFLNSAFTKLLGYTKPDIPTVEAHWPIFFPDVAYREKVQKDWGAMLEKSAKSGLPIEPMLLDIAAKNGEVKKLEVHSLQVGTLAITMWIDFTEKIKAEEALEKMAHRLSLALQSGSIGVWDLDLKTNETIWDDTMFKIYGLEKIVPIPYESWVKSVLPEDYPLAVASLERSMNNKEKQDVEFRIRRPDGNIRHIQASQDVVLDNDRNVIRVIGVNIDVTERKESEQKLLVRTKKLALLTEDLTKRNAELDEFTYIVSHDLQEPLRKLTAFSNLLKKDLGEDLPEHAQKDINFIVDAASRMQILIQDLLAFSRSGRKTMDLEQTDLNTCVDDALYALQALLEETDAVVERDSLPVVVGDRALITQLYQNLIGNALKFVNDVKPRIHIFAKKDGEMVELGVQDNGIGIQPEYQDQIFLPFKRLHGKSEYEGSGIGLAICQKVVERHGSKLSVESDINKGAIFSFKLKIA